MIIDFGFITYLTNVFISLLASFALVCFTMYLHGASYTQARLKYSAYLTWCHNHDAHNIFGIAGLISTAFFVLFSIIYLDIPTEDIANGVGTGAFVYAIALLLITYICLYVPIREKNDIKGVHKHLVRTQLGLLQADMERMQELAHYNGKTKLKVEHIQGEIKVLRVKVTEEKKIRKNSANIYRSIERLKEMALLRMDAKQNFDRLHTEILSIYDQYYEIESFLFHQRHEDAKKQLNVAKEVLEGDPFAAVPLLRRLKEQEKNTTD